jgi:cold-inducible RNA-binding protein
VEKRLYVGNLPYSATEDELRALFGQAGQVTSVVIIMDRETGRSKGFAFVEMATTADAQKALSMFNGYSLNRRALTVNEARPRTPGNGRGGRAGGGEARDY